MLSDGRGQIFEGKLDDYKRQAKLSGFPDVLEPTSVKPSDQKETGSIYGPKNKLEEAPREKPTEQEISALKREAQRLQKRITVLDSEMAKLHADVNGFDQRLEEAQSDFQLAAIIESEKTAAVSQLENYELEWLELSESVESIKSRLEQMGRSL